MKRFLLTILVLVGLIGSVWAHPYTDHYFHFVTSKNIGETITLEVHGSGAGYWNESNMTDGTDGNNTLTSQTVYFNQLQWDILILDHNNITSISGTHLPVTGSLVLAFNDLTSVDFASMSPLDHPLYQLKLNDNKLTNLNLGPIYAYYLDVWNNQLTSLDLSHAEEMLSLSCQNNKLTNLDLSNNTDLIYLCCKGNQLTALDLSNNTKLTPNTSTGIWGVTGQRKTVTCSILNNYYVVPLDNCAENDRVSNITVNGTAYTPAQNVITSGGKKYLVIGDAANIPVDVNGQTTVRYEYDTHASHAAYKTMDVTLTTTVPVIDINRKITLTTSKQVGETIYLSHKYTGDIIISGVEEAPQGSDVGYQTLDGKFVPKFAYTLTDQTVTIYGDVTHFRCHAQDVTSLDVSQNDVLARLYCQQNPLQALDVSGNTALTDFNTQECQLTTLDLSTNTSLWYLKTNKQKKTVDCEIVDGYYCLEINSDAENDLVSDVMLNGTAVDLPVKVISKDGKKYLVFASTSGTRPNSGENTVTYKYAHNGPSDLSTDSQPIMDVTLTTTVPVIDINRKITLTTSKAVGETIRLQCTYTGNIFIDGVSQTAGASGTETTYTLTKQTVTIYGDVTKFSCVGDSVTALDLSGNTILTEVSCANNKLTTLDVTKNSALTYLQCSSNQLSVLDVTHNTALTSLLCSNNQLTSLDVSNALITLYCGTNQLTSLDVSGNTALRNFLCYSNQLAELDVAQNNNLYYFDCSKNQLTALKLSANTAIDPYQLSTTKNQAKTVESSIIDGLYVVPISSSAENDKISDITVNGSAFSPATNTITHDGITYLVFGDASHIPASGQVTITYNYTTDAHSRAPEAVKTMNVTLTTSISNGTIKVVPGNWETRIALDYDTNVGLTVEGISDLTEPGASGAYATYCTDYDNSEEIIFTGLISSISADGQGIAAIDLTGDPYLTSVSLTDNQLMWLDLSKNKSLSAETGNGIDGQKRDVYVCKVGDYWVVPMMYGAKELKISHLKVGGNDFTPQLINDDEAQTSYLVVGDATAACPSLGSEITYDYITDNDTYPLMDVTLTITSEPGAIELFTDKTVGENFSLSIKGAGTIIVSGIDGVGTLTSDGFAPLNISGTLNSQTVRIEGTVSVVTCRSQSLNGVDVTNASGLNDLDVPDNNLTTFDLQNNQYLKYLTCDQNDLTGLDVSKNTELTYLSCIDCALTELDVTKNTKLATLLVGYDVPRGTRNNMASGSIDLSENTQLQVLHVENVGLNTLDVTNNIELVDLYASTNNLTTIDLKENSDLKNLDLAHNKLPEVDLQFNTELVYLDLTTNLLPTINVRKNTKLQDFQISDNLLPTLDVTTLSDLRLLNCAINQLPTLDVTHNTLLERLWCGTNNLTAVNLAQNPNLKGLYCEKNNIETLDATVNSQLLTLNCEENQIRQLNVEGLTELRQLQCNDNELYALDVTTCTNLGNPYGGFPREYMFYCQRNHLMTLDLSQNENVNKNSEAQVTLFGEQTLPVTPELVNGYLTIKMPTDAADSKVSNIVADGTAYVLSTKVDTQDDEKFLRFAKATKDKHYGADTEITYDYETGLTMSPNPKKMDVTLTMQNAHVQKIGTEGYGTLYLDYPALIPEGAEVYIVTDECINPKEQVVELGKEANKISGTTVPAYTPMLTKSTANEYILFNRSSEEGTAPEGTNLMKGTMEDISVAAKSVVTLGHEASSGDYGFWIYSGTTVHAWRTYMELDDVKGKMTSANAKGFALRFLDDETTGISSVSSVNMESAVYTLDGKKVCEPGQWNDAKNHLPKGVYIVGSRKVVIK